MLGKIASALNPYKWIITGVGAALLLVALVWGANRLVDSLKQSGRDEVQAKWDAEKAGAEKARADLQADLAQAFNGLDATLQSSIKTIAYRGQDITVRVKKELDNEPRYRSADCSLTPGVQREVNAARSLSRDTAPASVRSGTVSGSGAVARFEFGPSGDGGH